MPQSHNRYCPSTPVTTLLPLHKQTNTGNCTPSLHKTLCPSLTTVTALLPPSHHYCRYISRPIPVTAPSSLHKTLCPSLTTVTALLPPSHHYCRYIRRPIPVTAPPWLHKILCPSLTTVTALLPPSHHYCRYISTPIPVTAPPSLQKHTDLRARDLAQSPQLRYVPMVANFKCSSTRIICGTNPAVTNCRYT